MIPTSDQPTLPMPIEEMVRVSLCDAQREIRSSYRRCQDRVRESPATSILGAVAAGYLLHRLPVKAILVTQVRVLAALAPPALFLFGACKVYDFLQRREACREP